MPIPERCRGSKYRMSFGQSKTKVPGSWAECLACDGRGWGSTPLLARRAVQHRLEHNLPADAYDDLKDWESEMHEVDGA